MQKIISIDTETFLINDQEIIPKMVCLSAAFHSEGLEGQIKVTLNKHDDPTLFEKLLKALDDPEVDLVGHNIAFDMAVIGYRFPELIPRIFKKYLDGKIHCTRIIEILRTISTSGDPRRIFLPNGAVTNASYALTDLEKKYLGKDRSGEKKSSDAWRLRYGELFDVPFDEWPILATQYAKDDALGTLQVYEAQLDRPEQGRGSAGTEAFQAAADFCLLLVTSWGMVVDPERVQRFETALTDLLSPERMQPLYAAGVLTAADPGRPKKSGNGTTAPKPEKSNLSVLRELITKEYVKKGRVPPKTETGNISTDEPTVKEVSEWNPLLKIYHERQKHKKLQTTYLDVLKSGHVRFPFNILVSSGRTSSSGSDLYPSTNGQNQPRIGGEFSVRECFVARPGHLLISCDYSALELCVVAQTTFDLFGKSVHLDKINAGYDLHAYLGAQIAARMDERFSKASSSISHDPDKLYKLFMTLKKSEIEEEKKLFKHYRTFAKPTGLGYPGGLGPQTFIEFAKDTYDVVVDLNTAEKLREIWHNTYPEMRKYFSWVQTQESPANPGTFSYTSPMGMYRNACSYCEMANGRAMQTPAAEGFKAAIINVVRATFDESQESILLGCRVVNAIHDELLVEIPDDEKISERALTLSELMVSSMKLVLPDVNVKAEPALMDRWYKDAEPIYIDGKLVKWTPKG